jgi:hypothetical protein
MLICIRQIIMKIINNHKHIKNYLLNGNIRNLKVV